MITLHSFGPGFGLPELSPYVLKTEVQLQMAGLDYRKVRSRPQDGPKGQLPFIEDAGDMIGDSSFIRDHIEWTYGVNLDEGLSDLQKAQAWAIERLLENHLAWAVIHQRWLLADNFAKGPAHFFDAVPPTVRDQLRREAYHEVKARVRGVGLGRHSDEEIVDLGEKSLHALSVVLGDQPYLMGERACGTDASLFGVLACVLAPFFDSPLRERAERFGNLGAYVDRMMARYYPAFAWRREPARSRQVA